MTKMTYFHPRRFAAQAKMSFLSPQTDVNSIVPPQNGRKCSIFIDIQQFSSEWVNNYGSAIYGSCCRLIAYFSHIVSCHIPITNIELHQVVVLPCSVYFFS